MSLGVNDIEAGCKKRYKLQLRQSAKCALRQNGFVYYNMLPKCDFVTVHCPLTPQTDKLVNADFVAKMKDGAFLINTSRGAELDEHAVADALNSGKLAGAGLDVLTTEPPLADNPLLKAKNAWITPHIAWAPFETRERLLGVTEENIRAFCDGAPVNVVNHPSVIK